MIITNYRELREIVGLYLKRKQNFILISGGGLGKSTLIREIMRGKEYLFVNSKSTPLQTYLNIYSRKEKHIYAIFDDINDLLKSSITISMLKSFCDLEPIKQINYNSTSPLLNEVKQSCSVEGNAFIILNKLNLNNSEIKPLLDRCFVCQFEPTKEEIFKEMVRISSKYECEGIKEILGFIRENMKYVDISLRTFVKAIELYKFNKERWVYFLSKDMGLEYEQIRKQQEIDKVMNSSLKKSEKIKELAKIKNCSIRTIQRQFKVLNYDN